MKKYFIEKENDLILINFDNVFSEIEVDCLNDLENFGLIKDYQINLSKKDTKKLIYHHVIHGLCEEIRLNKYNFRKVFIIPPEIRSFHEMTQFCDKKDLQILLDKLIKQLKNSLPFLIYSCDKYIFEDNIDYGEREDLIRILSELSDNHSDKGFTFEKIKRFASKFELEFLSKEYFNSIKNTLLLG